MKHRLCLQIDRLEKRELLTGAAQLVRDINQLGLSANPSSVLEINGIAYFTANDSNTGNELWRTDGTDAGTELAQDIWLGRSDSHTGYFANISGTLFFTAYDGTSGEELWRSDGPEDGTIRVKDINAGPASGSRSNHANVSGVLYFRANDGTNGDE